MIQVNNLTVSVGKNNILNDVSLTIEAGEITALMGINGSGKSTLLNTITKHPTFSVKGGSIEISSTDIAELTSSEVSRMGVFISFQTPPDFPELTVGETLQMLHEVHSETETDFKDQYSDYLKLLSISEEMLLRPLNVGFSGGEKKRVELMQMIICKPKIILLDEIDTGLDIDNIIIVGKTISKYVQENNCTVIVVTHYLRFFEFVKPTKVFVINKGIIAASGGYEIAKEIEQNGYSSIIKN